MKREYEKPRLISHVVSLDLLQTACSDYEWKESGSCALWSIGGCGNACASYPDCTVSTGVSCDPIC